MRGSRVSSYTLVVVLAVELAVWEAFLVGARPFGTAFPLAALLAVAGNLLLGSAGARILQSRTGAAVPGVIWLVVALLLGSSRPEGDVVVTDGLRGLSFLLFGALAAAGAVARVGSPPPPGATPGAPGGR